MNIRKNGKPADGNSSMENAELEFPVKFQLKAVLNKTETDRENMKNLELVFNSLNVEYKYINNKISSKGTYVSYNYSVTLLSKQQLEELYQELKKVPGLKFAL